MSAESTPHSLAFALPAEVNGRIHQVSFVGQNRVLAEYVLEMGDPALPQGNSPIVVLIGQKINSNLIALRDAATKWDQPLQKGGPSLQEQIIGVFNSFEDFTGRYCGAYPVIVDAVSKQDDGIVRKELEGLKTWLSTCNSEINSNGTSTLLKDYLAAVSNAQAAFDKDWEMVIKQANIEVTTINGLTSAIATLQAGIAENNRQILTTVVDTSGKTLVQGATSMTSAGLAPPDGSKGIVAGVTGLTDVTSGVVQIVQLEQKTLENMEAISKLIKSLGGVESDLLSLLQVGSLLGALGGASNLDIRIVNDIIGFWRSLETTIDSLLDRKSGTIWNKIDITNYKAGKPLDNTSPPGNVTLPIQGANSYFQAVLGATLMQKLPPFRPA